MSNKQLNYEIHMSMMLFLISKTLAYRLGETSSGNKLNVSKYCIYTGN